MPKILPRTRYEYVSEAEEMYTAYREVQEQILKIEDNALKAASGNKITRAYLLNPTVQTDASYTYKSLCGDRDQYMARAQLAASMALMLGQR